MSVSLLVGLLPYWNLTNVGISPILEEISFWNFLETFLGCWYTGSKWIWFFGMLAGQFQLILEFLYVCQSVSWLTSLLKLDKYRHISGPEWYIFLKIFGDIPGMLFHHFQIILNFLYVCQSVSWHTSLLKLDKCRDISSSGWVIFMKLFYTLEISGRPGAPLSSSCGGLLGAFGPLKRPLASSPLCCQNFFYNHILQYSTSSLYFGILSMSTQFNLLLWL